MCTTAFPAAWGNWTPTKYSAGRKIILARLVNHAELMVLGGGFLDDDLVQLSQVQRCGIVPVIHAHDESGWAQFVSYQNSLTGWNMPMATKCVMMAAKVVPIAKRSQRYRCQSSRKPEA